MHNLFELFQMWLLPKTITKTEEEWCWYLFAPALALLSGWCGFFGCCLYLHVFGYWKYTVTLFFEKALNSYNMSVVWHRLYCGLCLLDFAYKHMAWRSVGTNADNNKTEYIENHIAFWFIIAFHKTKKAINVLFSARLFIRTWSLIVQQF